MISEILRDGIIIIMILLDFGLNSCSVILFLHLSVLVMLIVLGISSPYQLPVSALSELII